MYIDDTLLDKFQPILDNILIERLDQNGLYSPTIKLLPPKTGITRRHALGRVIKKGPGKNNRYRSLITNRIVDEGYVSTKDIQIGDILLYNTWGEHDGDTIKGRYKVISYCEDVKAIVGEDVAIKAQF